MLQSRGRRRHASVNALDGDGLGPLRGRRDGLLGRVERAVEQGVDQGRLSETRLA